MLIASAGRPRRPLLHPARVEDAARKRIAKTVSEVTSLTSEFINLCNLRIPVVCPLQQAYLCGACDKSIHEANSIASTHYRRGLSTPPDCLLVFHRCASSPSEAPWGSMNVRNIKVCPTRPPPGTWKVRECR